MLHIALEATIAHSGVSGHLLPAALLAHCLMSGSGALVKLGAGRPCRP